MERGENERRLMAGSAGVSDGVSLRDMLQAERRQHASIIKSSSSEQLLTTMKEGRLQSTETCHMLDLCLHSCF